MSDSGLKSASGLPADSVGGPTGSAGASGSLRTLLLVNGIVCCVLILALVFFGRRASPSNRETSAEPVKPIATATDVMEEDDDDGRPKTITIEMKWPASGIGDFELTERSGRKIRKADLVGHPWVVSFIFTNCAGPCSRVTASMKKLQDEFISDETDLRLVTITVDPERDQPEVLTKYADNFGADQSRWLFLTDPTGEKDKIYPLINGSFLMPVQEATGELRAPGFEFIHTNNVLLVNEEGVVQGKWLSTDEAEFDSLRRELKKRFRRD